MEPRAKDAKDGKGRAYGDQGQHGDAGSTEDEDFVTPPQSRSPSVHAKEPETNVFDGYSFDGCHSVVIDDDGKDSDLGYEGDDEKGGTVSKSPLVPGDIKGQKRPSMGVSSPSVGSPMGETSSRSGRPSTPSKSSTVLQKRTGKWEVDDWDLAPVGGEEGNELNGRSLFARGVVDRYRLVVPKSTSSRYGNPDKTPEGARGARLTGARYRGRKSRSGTISEGGLSGSHLSEGHQSPEDDGESKKKVDWYDV